MYPQHYSLRGKSINKPLVLYDCWLTGVVLTLLFIGLMMVASSSVMVSMQHYHYPFHYLLRQGGYLVIGIISALVIMRVPSKAWERWSVFLMIVSILLLLLVLIPGVGRLVNGSRRWIAMGPFGLQVSELTKMAMIFYIAGYLVRQKANLSKNIMGFIKPMILLVFVCVLLLMEPDFGAAVVIIGSIMGMLFLSEIKLRYYFSLFWVALFSLGMLAVSSPYRVARLTAFLDPWADQFNTGYQLTQSFIAFGRGGWLGVGLGESIQKLLYLPEAHTDFLFAVFAEEFGFLGIIIVLILYSILIMRGLLIGYTAYKQQRYFSSYMAYGLTFWLGWQVVINLGVNSGLLPTKGLTLPLLSYGGASMIINCIVIGLILRIDHENRWQFITPH